MNGETGIRESEFVNLPPQPEQPENGASNGKKFTIEDLAPDSNDPEAEKRHEQLRQRLIRILGNNKLWGNKAEDIAQDTLLHAWRKKEQFKGDNLLAWVMTIARSKLADYHRHHKNKDVNPLLAVPVEDQSEHEQLPDQGQDVESALLDRESEKQKEHYVNLLLEKNPDLKEIWDLHIRQSLSMEETAKALDLSVGTVKTRIFRAKEKLETIIKQQRLKEAVTLVEKRELIKSQPLAETRVNGHGLGEKKMQGEPKIQKGPETKPVMTVREYKNLRSKHNS